MRNDHLDWEKKYAQILKKSIELKLFDHYLSFEAITHLLESNLSFNIDEKEHKKILIIGIGRSDIIDVLIGSQML
jgi:hypothetical protein